jgi:hypothetical protein
VGRHVKRRPADRLKCGLERAAREVARDSEGAPTARIDRIDGPRGDEAPVGVRGDQHAIGPSAGNQRRHEACASERGVERPSTLHRAGATGRVGPCGIEATFDGNEEGGHDEVQSTENGDTKRGRVGRDGRVDVGADSGRKVIEGPPGGRHRHHGQVGAVGHAGHHAARRACLRARQRDRSAPTNLELDGVAARGPRLVAVAAGSLTAEATRGRQCGKEKGPYGTRELRHGRHTTLVGTG